MLDKPLEQITYLDLDQFVKEQWPEGKAVDYKRDLYGGKDEDKKELLKDASSFANTQGGDILIGVDEDKGLPNGIPGVSVDPDKEKLRLEEIIRRGLEPRIDFALHAVPTPTGNTVLIIRVKESLLFPHRVVFQGKFGEFWVRSSAGNYSMDTSELRRAFTLSETIYERIRTFRQDRVSQIVKGETPIPLGPGGKLVLHLVPVESVRSRTMFDVTKMPRLCDQFPPLEGTVHGSRLNLDGVVTFHGTADLRLETSYVQLFKNGMMEAVLKIKVSQDGEEKYLWASHYERAMLKTLGTYLKSYRGLAIRPPIWVFLTLMGVKNIKIRHEDQYQDNGFNFDREILYLPEWVIETLDIDVTEFLRPIFDLIWNAAGLPRCLNFDAHGKWLKGW